MHVFLYSPYGNNVQCLGSESIWKVFTNGHDMRSGTWYYGPLEKMPYNVFPKVGWLVGYQGSLELKNNLAIMSIVECFSLDSLNGIKQAVEYRIPMILVSRSFGYEKRNVFKYIVSKGLNLVGLIDSNYQQMEYVLHAGMAGIYYNPNLVSSNYGGTIITRNMEEVLFETRKYWSEYLKKGSIVN